MIVVKPEARTPLMAVVVKLLALPMFTEPLPLKKITAAAAAPRGARPIKCNQISRLRSRANFFAGELSQGRRIGFMGVNDTSLPKNFNPLRKKVKKEDAVDSTSVSAGIQWPFV